MALGAFGSHGLRHLVTVELLQTWRTGVEYQFLHALALLVLALHPESKQFHWPMGLWSAGVLLFSGSLYALVLTEQRGFAYLTPIGGVALIAGWLVLAWVTGSRRGTDAR